jgi:hypothetical protein
LTYRVARTKTIALHFLILTSICKADADARMHENASIRADSVNRQPRAPANRSRRNAA